MLKLMGLMKPVRLLLTDLVFMNRTVQLSAGRSGGSTKTDVWTSQPFDESTNAAEFASVVEQTYENTCDRAQMVAL